MIRWAAGLLLAAGASAATVTEHDGAVHFLGGTYRLRVDAQFALTIEQVGRAGTIATGGLWRARLADNRWVAADSYQGKTSREVHDDTAQFLWSGGPLDVVVSITPRDSHLDLTARITARAAPILDFELPGRLAFDPEQTERLVWPMNGNQGVGLALNQAFFRRQPEDEPSGWQSRAGSPAGYEALFGAGLDQRPDNDPPVPLTATDEGHAWLGEALAARVAPSRAIVNRPSRREQLDLLLVDSPNGPYFGAARLGGRGALWRLGGRVGDAEEALAVELVSAVIGRLAATPGGRRSLALVSLVNGPPSGGWAAVEVATWRERLSRAAVRAGLHFAELTTPAELVDAAEANETLVILNPYGEGLPTPAEGGRGRVIDAIRRFVAAGGHWFEVGGYPFYYELRPVDYYRRSELYPAAFADFFHLTTRAGSLAVYRVQPRDWEPWSGARERAAIFLPGRLECGGEPTGGYAQRGYAVYVAADETLALPPVRIAVGAEPPADLAAYCAANGITRALAKKVRPEVLKRLKRAVLLYYAGSCAEQTAYLDRLPVPTLLHFAQYLHGGFDKQYPDHLPPRADYGTLDEMRAFLRTAQGMGHLIMPYTNPTWWCDEPKGPTFEREGDAPLLRNLDGSLSHERYAANVGWTVCHWHPAVQAANRETVRQFTEDLPVDVLFQDQCGARGWRYDTNPASPTADAYIEGLLSMIDEDSRRVPLATESGWDRVVNAETQLCGMSWQVVPTEGGPSWRRLLAHEVSPRTWTVYPLAQYIAHDKTMMLHHDLGQFVTNREVLAWTLALGFSLSYRCAAASLERDSVRQWLGWLGRLQQSVCARYIGEPVIAFAHERGAPPNATDAGSISATYGPVSLVANLGPVARTVEGHRLPPFGFRASAPGVLAANLAAVGQTQVPGDGSSFVVEAVDNGWELWVYDTPEQTAPVELPAASDGAVQVTFDDSPPQIAAVRDGAVRVTLPARQGVETLVPPADLAGRKPAEWPGAKPSIGVIDLGPSVRPSWTAIQPAAWAEALRESRLATAHGLRVELLTSPAAVRAALAAGVRRWFCIVNPYGEGLPADGPGRWREILDAVRDYVRHGGHWWETAGYSFHHAIVPHDRGYAAEPIGPSGMGYLGLPVGGGDVDAPAEPLQLTETGRALMGDGLVSVLALGGCPVNRGLPTGHDDPGHLTLVRGPSGDYIGGYPMDGWGMLWRIGGFNPRGEVVVPIVIAAIEAAYTNVALPKPDSGTRFLWHARARPIG